MKIMSGVNMLNTKIVIALWVNKARAGMWLVTENKKYMGKGVGKAIKNIRDKIAPAILGFDATEQEIGAAYLFHATKVKADILVKGAYARSRIRQMILGGRTRHIITNTEIPVLLCK